MMSAHGPDSEPPDRPAFLKRLLWMVLAVIGALAIGGLARQGVMQNETKTPTIADDRVVVRIAHSFNDPKVAVAFHELTAAYTRLHPNVEIRVQAVPLRVYRQWIRTQLIGGEPPDLVEPLGTGGVWEELATQYLEPLTARVLDPNPYNEGTPLADVPWKDSYLDNMEAGYFLHLMEFYAVPFSLNNQRIIYNRDLLAAVQGGSAQPPRDFRSWLALGMQIKAWAEQHNRSVAPLAVSRDDFVGNGGLFTRYFRTLTGNMMERFDMQSWGAPNSTLTLWGLMNGTIDLKQPRLRAACAAVRDLAGLCQNGFGGSLPDDKRFLFLQGKAAMVLGDTRDFGLYKQMADFAVEAFEFPAIGPDDPEYGRFYEGPYWEGQGSVGLRLAVSRDGLHRDIALDFLRFATSLHRNEVFCTSLAWFPAIREAEVSLELKPFQPQVLGVQNTLELSNPNSGTETYLEQNLPLYLDGQLTFDLLMDGLRIEWLEHGWSDLSRTLEMRLRGHASTDANVTLSKARLLFAEAGNPAEDIIRGDRTRYQLGLEIIQLLDSNIMRRKYIHANLPRGHYIYPPPVAESALPTPIDERTQIP